MNLQKGATASNLDSHTSSIALCICFLTLLRSGGGRCRVYLLHTTRSGSRHARAAKLSNLRKVKTKHNPNVSLPEVLRTPRATAAIEILVSDTHPNPRPSFAAPITCFACVSATKMRCAARLCAGERSNLGANIGVHPALIARSLWRTLARFLHTPQQSPTPATVRDPSPYRDGFHPQCRFSFSSSTENSRTLHFRAGEVLWLWEDLDPFPAGRRGDKL